MEPRAKISAIIITYNEEDNIRGALDSCSFADEILVVDSFSTDGTARIVRSAYPDVRLLEHEFSGYAAQKNWAIEQASHPWIFLLDADERVGPGLVEELRAAVVSGLHAAYAIPRKNRFMDRELRFVWRGDSVIRLIRRDHCRYGERHVHEEIETTGSVGRLTGHLVHDTYRYKGLRAHIEKNDRYSTLAAYDRVDRIGRVTMYHLMVKPLAAFLKRYLLRGGILDGRQGLIVSMFGMWSVFMRNVKIWRLQEGEKMERGRVASAAEEARPGAGEDES